jgi:hypothetical protein
MPFQDAENGAVGAATLMGLPVELLHEIWRLCWEPRTVEVHPNTNDEIQDRIDLFSSDTYRSTVKPPVTLFICRQSRIDTLRYYKLSFAAYKQEPQVYFNFQIDEVYVKHPELARFQQVCLMFPHEDLSKIRHLRVSGSVMQKIFNDSTRYNPQDQPWWVSEDPMTGLLGLKTLVVQQEMALASPVQTRNACFWDIRLPMSGSPRRNPPWQKVFEYLGEGAWPIVSIDGHQGPLQYPEIEWYRTVSLGQYCCRPDPIGTLRTMRKLQKSHFLYLEKLPCRCLLSSTMRWAGTGPLGDPETGMSCYAECRHLYDKFSNYTTSRFDPDNPPNPYNEGSGNRMKGLKRQYMAWKCRRDIEEISKRLTMSTARL